MLQLNRVLFARDFSECSERALPYALALARRLHAELHFLYADVPQGEPAGPAVLAASHDALREHLERVMAPSERRAFDPGGVHILSVVVRGLAAAPVILDYAQAQDVDLVVLGTHGRRGLRHVLLGSVAEEVVRLSACPVLTVGRTQGTPEAFANLHSILVPIDFSRYAGEALLYAKELAALFGARLDLLHVVDVRYHPSFFDTGLFSIYDVAPDAEATARIQMKQLYHDTGGPDGPAVRVEARTGPAAWEIARYAEEHASSLIVMATHGLTGLSHFLMGSVAERVVRTAPCPVFTVKPFGKSLVRETLAAAGAERG